MGDLPDASSLFRYKEGYDAGSGNKSHDKTEKYCDSVVSKKVRLLIVGMCHYLCKEGQCFVGVASWKCLGLHASYIVGRWEKMIID